MHAPTQSGFTLIEAILFLAVSSLLFLIAVVGTGSLMTSVRFSDSMRTTQAFFQSQYDQILNGVNEREQAETCGVIKGKCLLLGRLFQFEKGSGDITSYYVVATRVPDLAGGDATKSDQELLAEAAKPVVVKGGAFVSTFQIPWGAQVLNTRRSDDTAVNTYALLRSPGSSRLLSYTFTVPTADLAGDGTLALSSYLADAANAQRSTNICVQSVDSPDRPAVVTVANGDGQNAIALKFDVENVTDECDGDAA